MTRFWSGARRTNNTAAAPASRLDCTVTPIHDSIAQFRWNCKTGACWWSSGFGKVWGFAPSAPASIELARSRQHPDDRARLDKERGRLLREGGAYETTFRIVLPDGATRWVTSKGYMELDASGQPEVLSGVIIDITGFRTVQDAQDSEAGRLREALACGGVGVFDYDIIADRGLWSSEQCRIFGVEPRIFVPKMATMWALIHPEDRPYLQGLLSGSMESGAPYAAKFRVVRPSGEVRWCIGGAAASLDDDGRVVRFSGITYDITDRVTVEEKLSAALQRNEQLLTEKDLLLREMNHRIKNKLQLVTSLLNSQSRKSDDQRLRYAITEAVVRVSTVGKLFERLQHPETSPTVHIPTYLGDLCAELHAALAGTEYPQISCSVANDTLEPETAHALGLLIVELVTNALKHGERGAPITVSYLIRADGKRQLLVANSGTLPVDFNPLGSQSLGMQVIGAMVARLKGKFKFRQHPVGPRVECTIIFRPPLPR